MSQNQSMTLNPALSENLSKKELLYPHPPLEQKVPSRINLEGEPLCKDQIVMDSDSLEEYHSAQRKIWQDLLG